MQFFIPYPTLPDLLALHSTSVNYALFRDEVGSQGLIPDFRQHTTLLCRQYFSNALDSYVQIDCSEIPTNALSSQFDDETITEDRFLAFFTSDCGMEPQSYTEFISSTQSNDWVTAMCE